MATGFHQMEIEEDDQHVTLFITPFGLYQWKLMRMGLWNAQGAVRRLMELVFTGLNYEVVLVSFDNVLTTLHES